jgi:release factor glutamine methyltransferase
VTDVRAEALERLAALGVSRHEARWLVDEFLVGSDLDAWSALEVAAARRLSGEPLQYIMGHWPFRTLDLDVDSRVLIPRPETEELVDIALAQLARGDARNPLILDLGCGSGAIGLSLAKELGERGIASRVIAVDESIEALDVARRNARRHGLSTVSFLHSSWYQDVDISLEGRVDLIVSNPPYVSSEDLAGAQPELAHEPLGALVAPPRDGVEAFDDLATIIDGAPRWLRSGGSLVLEHGARQSPDVTRRLFDVGFVEVKDDVDLGGLPRVAHGRWP